MCCRIALCSCIVPDDLADTQESLVEVALTPAARLISATACRLRVPSLTLYFPLLCGGESVRCEPGAPRRRLLRGRIVCVRRRTQPQAFPQNVTPHQRGAMHARKSPRAVRRCLFFLPCFLFFFPRALVLRENGDGDELRNKMD